MKPRSFASYNRERLVLITKRHVEGITPAERDRLVKLQNLAVALANVVAPLPGGKDEPK